MLKVTVVLFISFLCGLKAQETVESCFCGVAMEDRIACSAGMDLSPEECVRNHCCSSEAAESGHSCFERRESCENDKCKISPTRRRPCGSWQLGKADCDAMNCCFDHRMFPYCYQSKDNGAQQKQKKLEPSATEKSNPTPSDDDDFVIVDPIPQGSNTTQPENVHLIKVECNTNENRQPCADAFVTRDTCLQLSCCWAPSPNEPSCFHTTTTPVDSAEGYLTDLEKLFEGYIDGAGPEEHEFELPLVPDEEFNYEDFSVLIECLNQEVAGITRELCEANNRNSCLYSSCCWNGTHCFKPVTKLSNETHEIVIHNGPHGNTTDAVFVDVNVHESVANKRPTCDITKAALSCGYVGINRTTCLNMGCCWMPEFAMRDRHDMMCTFPVYTDYAPQEPENSDDLPTFWSSWKPWSSCYVTKPCSNQAERRRWRKCIRNKTGSPKFIKGGCLLQAEETEIIPCYNPTECLETEWSEWGPWSDCSLSCGGFGSRERQRECIKGDGLEENPICEATHSAFNRLIAQTQLKECLRRECPK